MLTIIHGEDVTSSRNFFFNQKDKASISFDAKDLNLDEFEHEIRGKNLFVTDKKILIENLYSQKAKKNHEKIVKILNESPADLEIYIWEGKAIPKSSLNSLPKHNDKQFIINQNIFAFLDCLKPNNKNSIVLFHELLENTDVQIIFLMLVRQFRLLLALTDNNSKTIDEVKRLKPWQKSKLTKQAGFFKISKLKDVYKKLYIIDKSVKTGTTKLTLTQNIDILLAEI